MPPGGFGLCLAVDVKGMVHMILILPKGTAHTKKNRLLNNTGAIFFTTEVVGYLLLVVRETNCLDRARDEPPPDLDSSTTPQMARERRGNVDSGGAAGHPG